MQKAQNPQNTQNLRGDVISALRGAGPLSLFEIAQKISQLKKVRYSEAKIQQVLDILINGKQVEQSDNVGRPTYRWAADEVVAMIPDPGEKRHPSAAPEVKKLT